MNNEKYDSLNKEDKPVLLSSLFLEEEYTKNKEIFKENNINLFYIFHFLFKNFEKDLDLFYKNIKKINAIDELIANKIKEISSKIKNGEEVKELGENLVKLRESKSEEEEKHSSYSSRLKRKILSSLTKIISFSNSRASLLNKEKLNSYANSEKKIKNLFENNIEENNIEENNKNSYYYRNLLIIRIFRIINNSISLIFEKKFCIHINSFYYLLFNDKSDFNKGHSFLIDKENNENNEFYIDKKKTFIDEIKNFENYLIDFYFFLTRNLSKIEFLEFELLENILISDRNKNLFDLNLIKNVNEKKKELIFIIENVLFLMNFLYDDFLSIISTSFNEDNFNEKLEIKTNLVKILNSFFISKKINYFIFKEMREEEEGDFFILYEKFINKNSIIKENKDLILLDNEFNNEFINKIRSISIEEECEFFTDLKKNVTDLEENIKQWKLSISYFKEEELKKIKLLEQEINDKKREIEKLNDIIDKLKFSLTDERIKSDSLLNNEINKLQEIKNEEIRNLTNDLINLNSLKDNLEKEIINNKINSEELNKIKEELEIKKKEINKLKEEISKLVSNSKNSEETNSETIEKLNCKIEELEKELKKKISERLLIKDNKFLISNLFISFSKIFISSEESMKKIIMYSDYFSEKYSFLNEITFPKIFSFFLLFVTIYFLINENKSKKNKK